MATNSQLWMGIATIIAVILGPILALRIEKRLEIQRSAYNRKLDIFRKLLVTRAAVLNVNHVDALNLIEAEYDSRKESDKKVLDRWREYWDHLNTKQGDKPGETERWGNERNRILSELLFEMSTYLNVGVDRSILKRASYYPLYLQYADEETTALRKALVEMYDGKKPLRVVIVEDKEEGPAKIAPGNG